MDKRVLQYIPSWPESMMPRLPSGTDETDDWVIIIGSYVPRYTARGEMWLSLQTTRDHREWVLPLKGEKLETFLVESNYPYTTGEGDKGYLVLVRAEDLRIHGWDIDHSTVPTVSSAVGRQIPDYPGTCLICGDRIYVGLFEIEHKSKKECRGLVR